MQGLSSFELSEESGSDMIIAMHKARVQTKVSDILSLVLSTYPPAICPNDKLIENLGMDSLSEIDLLDKVCDEFLIDFTLEDLCRCRTVEDLTVKITKLVNTRPL
jgi:acyl carrier protein